MGYLYGYSFVVLFLVGIAIVFLASEIGYRLGVRTVGHGVSGNISAASDALDRAATDVAAALRSDLLDAPSAKVPADLDRLSGALSDALRRPRGTP